MEIEICSEYDEEMGTILTDGTHFFLCNMMHNQSTNQSKNACE